MFNVKLYAIHKNYSVHNFLMNNEMNKERLKKSMTLTFFKINIKVSDESFGTV